MGREKKWGRWKSKETSRADSNHTSKQALKKCVRASHHPRLKIFQRGKEFGFGGNIWEKFSAMFACDGGSGVGPSEPEGTGAVGQILQPGPLEMTGSHGTHPRKSFPPVQTILSSLRTPYFYFSLRKFHPYMLFE